MKKKKKKKKKRRHDLFFQFHVVFFLFLPLTEFSVPFYALTQTTDGCYFLNTHTRWPCVCVCVSDNIIVFSHWNWQAEEEEDEEEEGGSYGIRLRKMWCDRGVKFKSWKLWSESQTEGFKQTTDAPRA